MSPVLIGVLGYVLIQLVIGVLVSRRIRSESDYLLAGRNIGLPLATFSIFATWFGAETCIGAAGTIYGEGLSGGAADPFGYAICLFLVGLFFAVPLWRRQFTTLADLYRERFSPNVERLAVLIMVPTSVMWAAAQIRAFGQVIAASSTFEVEIAITAAAVVVIVYTVYGGLLADIVTDMVQGIALIIGLVVLLFVVVDAAGGFEAAARTIEPARLNLFGAPGTNPLQLIEKWATPIVGSLLAQELVARTLAARSPQIARRATLLGGGVYLAVGLIPVFLGLVGAKLLPGLGQPEQFLPLLAQKHLSTFFYVLFAGALISAILSTVDSALLAASALVEHNLVVSFRPGMSEARKVRLARVGVVIFGVLAYVLALHAEGVYALVQEASAFGSAGIVTVAVFGLFTRFGGVRAATASLLAGIALWVAGKYVLHLSTPYLVSLAGAIIAYAAFAFCERSRAPSSEAA